MSYESYKSLMANYLYTRTTLIKDIRDHLPAGFEHFQLFEDDKEFSNYYEFIDGICPKRPHNFKIILDYAVISFNELSWKWEIDSNESDKDFAELLNALNQLEEKARFLRDFLQFQNLNKE